MMRLSEIRFCFRRIEVANQGKIIQVHTIYCVIR